MSREWKPGDVTFDPDHDEIALVVDGRHCHGHVGRHIHYGDDWNAGTAVFDRLRPLVVIDPEDREQVERLVSRWTAADVGDGLPFTDALQAALRSFIDPPKPEEPTGHWAIVSDDHRTYCLAAWKNDRPWCAIGTSEYFNYDEIAVARVLSEGVAP